MVTLKHIAAEAGATIATVSLALRGSPDISAARRDDIRAIAERLGYRRNAHVSTLMRHIRQGKRHLPRSPTIALLLAHPQSDARKRFVLIEQWFNGMEKRVKERGYRPDFFWYNEPGMTPARLHRIFEARGIRGVALVLCREFEPNVVELDWDRFAVASQKGSVSGPRIHRVGEDYFANTVTAMTQLWRSGCRRIGLAHRNWHARSGQFQITAAYHEFLIRRCGSFAEIPALFIPGEADGWTEATFLEWFRRERPDAILTFDWGDIPGWLRMAGLRIPEDVSVAVLNRCPSAPEFSGIDPEPEQLGAALVDLVVEQLENNEYGLPRRPKLDIISGKWSEGRTTRPVALSGADS